MPSRRTQARCCQSSSQRSTSSVTSGRTSRSRTRASWWIADPLRLLVERGVEDRSAARIVVRGQREADGHQARSTVRRHGRQDRAAGTRQERSGGRRQDPPRIHGPIMTSQPPDKGCHRDESHRYARAATRSAWYPGDHGLRSYPYPSALSLASRFALFCDLREENEEGIAGPCRGTRVRTGPLRRRHPAQPAPTERSLGDPRAVPVGEAPRGAGVAKGGAHSTGAKRLAARQVRAPKPCALAQAITRTGSSMDPLSRPR